MKKIIQLLFLSALLPAFTLHAQEDAKARKILDELTKKTKSYKSISASYTSHLVNEADGVDSKEEGTIKMKGDKYKLEIGDYVVYNNTQTIWNYSKEDNEVTLNDPEEFAEEMKPSDLFTIYENGFKSKYVEEKNGQHIIKLFPTKPQDKPYHTIIIYIDKAKIEMKKIVIKNKDGNIYTYTVKKMDTATTLPDATFTFDKSKHPGVEVNDMR